MASVWVEHTQNHIWFLDQSSCDVFVEEFSLSVANFTSCIVTHSRPFSVCMQCYEQYKSCQSIYDVLLKTTDAERGRPCADKIVSNDYVKMILKVHDFVEDAWTRCYAGNDSTDLANSTIEFLRRLTLFNGCIFNELADNMPYIIPGILPVNKTVCKVCSASYKNLSDYYSTLDPDFNGHFCMDLSDSMNFTWNLWHENFKCPARVRLTDVCISTSIALLVIPILFYLLARICRNSITKIFLRGVTSYARSACCET
ncbi:hypothetical protein HELRODRAFT_158885 [Helobdella robusta]|uniref:Osteopetrosis-associated transmembrane protein 1 n=1 Tax=Helobdella robusta TaxID=6412 RepID=T1END5_HELRO|nr:hypothetical protein HELRODRAFT_158885 [Helobdella robusta]ESO12375.1 hypothetical protein HELRODRAFT_158885 [Helobdella robusta]